MSSDGDSDSGSISDSDLVRVIVTVAVMVTVAMIVTVAVIVIVAVIVVVIVAMAKMADSGRERVTKAKRQRTVNVDNNSDKNGAVVTRPKMSSKMMMISVTKTTKPGAGEFM